MLYWNISCAFIMRKVSLIHVLVFDIGLCFDGVLLAMVAMEWTERLWSWLDWHP
jgi:hypothetical protein